MSVLLFVNCVLVSGVVWVWPVVGRAVPFRATGGVECA
jgi:hypothetical protein